MIRQTRSGPLVNPAIGCSQPGVSPRISRAASPFGARLRISLRFGNIRTDQQIIRPAALRHHPRFFGVRKIGIECIGHRRSGAVMAGGGDPMVGVHQDGGPPIEERQDLTTG